MLIEIHLAREIDRHANEAVKTGDNADVECGILGRTLGCLPEGDFNFGFYILLD